MGRAVYNSRILQHISIERSARTEEFSSFVLLKNIFLLKTSNDGRPASVPHTMV